MNLVLAGVVVVVAAGVAIAALLFIRRNAPDGGYFHDGDRAAGVFGVLATGFAVLLGFIVFLAFESYDQSRSGAETEALMVAQQYETAQFFPADATDTLGGQLICYGRYVVHQEWPRMEEGSSGDALNPWGIALFHSLQATQPEAASEQAAYSKWLDQTSDREAARQDRLHGAEGVIPWPVWLAIVAMAGMIFVFMLFFADSGEPAVVQGLQIGAVVVVIVMTLLVIQLLDSPFHSGPGGLRPAAMERTLRILEEEVVAGLGDVAPAPCTADGDALDNQR
jgi:hypothetical protein